MQLLPDYCAVNVLLGGSLADQSRVRRKKKLFDFLFQTICEKVHSTASYCPLGQLRGNFGLNRGESNRP